MNESNFFEAYYFLEKYSAKKRNAAENSARQLKVAKSPVHHMKYSRNMLNAAEHMPEAKLLKLKECELILRNTEPRK